MLNATMGTSTLTRISNANSDITSLKLSTIQSQCLLQSIESCKFCITKALGLHLHFILDNSNICTFASGKEVRNISDGCIKREVAKMDSKRRLIGKGKFLTNRVTYDISIQKTIEALPPSD